MLDENYIVSICNSILSNSKVKKLDLYTIFRLLTGKKNRIPIDFNKVPVNPSVEPEEEIQVEGFISQVNPFFRNDPVKKSYYVQNYKIAKLLLERCEELELERQKISWFRAKDKSKRNWLTNDDFYGDNDKEPAIFYTKKEAIEEISKFQKLYKFLEINKEIELFCFNKQNEILEIFEFN
jgi:hypothetical protein